MGLKFPALSTSKLKYWKPIGNQLNISGEIETIGIGYHVNFKFSGCAEKLVFLLLFYWAN
jgi:hypothetical protein